jgi:hypothetical protein
LLLLLVVVVVMLLLSSGLSPVTGMFFLVFIRDLYCVGFRFQTAVLGVLIAVYCSGSIECSGKGNAIPVQAWAGPEGFRRLRFTYFKTIGK